MFLIEVITDTEYWTSTRAYEDLDQAQCMATTFRLQLCDQPGFVAVRIINLANVRK